MTLFRTSNQFESLLCLRYRLDTWWRRRLADVAKTGAHIPFTRKLDRYRLAEILERFLTPFGMTGKKEAGGTIEIGIDTELRGGGCRSAVQHENHAHKHRQGGSHES
jgi:hypothetical protein